MDTKVEKIKRPMSRPETEVDVSDLLIRHTPANEGKIIEEVELKSGEQTRVFLGLFESHVTPKGFSIVLDPKTVDNDEVIKQITKLELENGYYELVLHLANYSAKVVSIEVRKPA
jgi:hypothetical protein